MANSVVQSTLNIPNGILRKYSLDVRCPFLELQVIVDSFFKSCDSNVFNGLQLFEFLCIVNGFIEILIDHANYSKIEWVIGITKLSLVESSLELKNNVIFCGW